MDFVDLLFEAVDFLLEVFVPSPNTILLSDTYLMGYVFAIYSYSCNKSFCAPFFVLYLVVNFVFVDAFCFYQLSTIIAYAFNFVNTILLQLCWVLLFTLLTT